MIFYIVPYSSLIGLSPMSNASRNMLYAKIGQRSNDHQIVVLSLWFDNLSFTFSCSLVPRCLFLHFFDIFCPRFVVLSLLEFFCLYFLGLPRPIPMCKPNKLLQSPNFDVSWISKYASTTCIASAVKSKGGE